jgi:hypothetical protein
VCRLSALGRPPDACGLDAAFKPHAANAGISRDAFEPRPVERTFLKRLPKLSDGEHGRADGPGSRRSHERRRRQRDMPGDRRLDAARILPRFATLRGEKFRGAVLRIGHRRERFGD